LVAHRRIRRPPNFSSGREINRTIEDESFVIGRMKGLSPEIFGDPAGQGGSWYRIEKERQAPVRPPLQNRIDVEIRHQHPIRGARRNGFNSMISTKKLNPYLNINLLALMQDAAPMSNAALARNSHTIWSSAAVG
jgi:hypothetical protein